MTLGTKNSTPIEVSPEDRAIQVKAEARTDLKKALERVLRTPGAIPSDLRARLAKTALDVDRELKQRDEPSLWANPGEIAAALLEAEAHAPILESLWDLIENMPPTPPSIWGDDEVVLWGEGQPLMITGTTGIGKTTLWLRLVLALTGVEDPEVLGYPVVPTDRKVVYLAADRPLQILGNARRMMEPGTRGGPVLVHRGPLVWDIAHEPHRLAEWLTEIGAGIVIVDSLKDLTTRLSDDEAGGRVNRCLQLVTKAGIEVGLSHHDNKSTEANNIDKVFGSSLITSGVGSVLSLRGEPGDPVVTLKHLKPVTAPMPPARVLLGENGTVTVAEGGDPLKVLSQSPGMTAAQMAVALYGSDGPSNREKARRVLKRLKAKELVYEVKGQKGGTDGTTPSAWYPTTPELPPLSDE